MNVFDVIKNHCQNEKILFVCYSGSKLFGTNSENSDTDIKFVYLPNIKSMILGNYNKNIVFSTNNSERKNSQEDIDFVGYSLQYFLELLKKGETNAVDLFFSHTNTDAIVYKDSYWEKIILEKDKLINRNINSYCGFCRSQCIKYSIKGEKINNFKKLESFCEGYIGQTFCGVPLTLKIALNMKLNDGIEQLISDSFNKKIMFNQIDFGNDCYIVTALNKESFLEIHGMKFGLNETVRSTIVKIEKILSSYGKRASICADNNGIDYKAISHCIRMLDEVEQLLTNGNITFPLSNREYIKDVKYNRNNISYEQLLKNIDKRLEIINNVLVKNTKLVANSDEITIKNLILNAYNFKED